MKVYNEEKTQELTEYDLEKGYLKEDEIITAHHDATVGKTVSEQVEELKNQSVSIKQVGEKYYKVLKTYANGGSEVAEIKTIDPTAEYDEKEDIQIYILYTEEELEEKEKDKLRAWRSQCFEVIDRACWYDCLTDSEKAEVKDFRLALLDITETMTKPTVPECVQTELDKEV